MGVEYNTGLQRFFRKVVRMKLSQGLDVVLKVARRGRGERRSDYWFRVAVGSLIDCIGDKRLDNVTPDDIQSWYESLQTAMSTTNPDRHLSPYTVDSYARAVRAYFNRLVDMGHLDKSPYQLRLAKLPKKPRKDIPQDDIALMVQYSKKNIRDHALVLLLRDSGARVGELLTMQASEVQITENEEGRMEGVAPVYGEKMAKHRYIMFGHDACAALKEYMDIRPYNAPDTLWLGKGINPLTPSGVYQMLRRIGKAAGVKRFNPHAFRHALAKHMLNNNTPIPIMAEILGHEDPQTTITMYIQIDSDELKKMYRRYVGYTNT